MQLKLVHSTTGKQAQIEVDLKEDNVESLLILASAELELDTELLRINYKNQTIYVGPAAGGTTSQQQAAVPLSSLNLVENDLIQVATGAAAPAASSTSAPATTGSNASADQELLRMFGNNNNNNNTRPAPVQQQPPAAATGGDQALLNLFAQGLQNNNNTNNNSNQMMQRADSQDPEYQKKIYEEIQRKNIEENLTNALEYTPEAFARVTMLYVPSEVNGHKMAAFIDSGAQMTVMSEDCAEKCGLTRLIDRKWGGMAHGVGTTKIVGRVHLAMVKIADQHLPMSISILAAKNMDFLVGLDQLKRHQMMIDLKNNELKIDETHSAKFMSEHELPKELKDGIPTHEAGAAAQATNNNNNNNDDNANAAQQQQQLPQRRAAEAPQPAASSAPTSSSNSTQQQQQESLTEEQKSKVNNLKEMFGVNDAVATQTLKAADWNAEVAANMILSMVT